MADRLAYILYGCATIGGSDVASYNDQIYANTYNAFADGAQAAAPYGDQRRDYTSVNDNPVYNQQYYQPEQSYAERQPEHGGAVYGPTNERQRYGSPRGGAIGDVASTYDESDAGVTSAGAGKMSYGQQQQSYGYQQQQQQQYQPQQQQQQQQHQQQYQPQQQYQQYQRYEPPPKIIKVIERVPVKEKVYVKVPVYVYRKRKRKSAS